LYTITVKIEIPNQGKDIYDCNRTLTLGLVWQLMRAYTLSVLAKCASSGQMATDREIVDWANQKVVSFTDAMH